MSDSMSLFGGLPIAFWCSQSFFAPEMRLVVQSGAGKFPDSDGRAAESFGKAGRAGSARSAAMRFLLQKFCHKVGWALAESGEFSEPDCRSLLWVFNSESSGRAFIAWASARSLCFCWTASALSLDNCSCASLCLSSDNKASSLAICSKCSCSSRARLSCSLIALCDSSCFLRVSAAHFLHSGGVL